MKNRRKYSLYMLLFGLLLSVSGCGVEKTTDEQNSQSEYAANSETGTEEPELRTFLFQSAEEAESISDEDLIYIAQNKYKTADFISDIDSGGYDLFDIPLMEKEVDGVLYSERVETYVLQSKLPLKEVDVNEEISTEAFQELIDEHCSVLIEAANTWDGDTGSRTRDEEIIYCGENDFYVEYSIRYTELRSYYDNDKLVTLELPRAYRRCFLKNELSVEDGNRMGPVYFGELSLEKVKNIEDFDIFVDSRPSIYRNVQETDTAYVYTNYQIHIIGGDYGLCDRVVLEKVDSCYDKTTHEITNTGTDIKSVEIPGTENYDDIG